MNVAFLLAGQRQIKLLKKWTSQRIQRLGSEVVSQREFIDGVIDLCRHLFALVHRLRKSTLPPTTASIISAGEDQPNLAQLSPQALFLLFSFLSLSLSLSLDLSYRAEALGGIK